MELDRFLFQYRITSHTTTGSTPAELLMGRTLRSRLDLLLPNVQTRVVSKQIQQKANHDLHSKTRGDTVYTRNYSDGSKWIPGVITEITGPVSYKVTHWLMARYSKDILTKFVHVMSTHQLLKILSNGHLTLQTFPHCPAQLHSQL